MEIKEAYKAIKKIAEKQIIEVANKGSMNPAEAEAVKVGMCLIDMIDEKEEDMEGIEGEYSERNSRRSYAPRRYNITSYEDGRSMRGGRGGQSNRGFYENQNRDRMGRYSSHSIDDRIVDHLERMMDEAESDYERQRLQEYMRYVRSKENGD